MSKKDVKNKLYTDEKLDTSTFKCPNCAGESEFSIKDQKMKCLYCGSLFDIDNNNFVEERDLSELLKNGQVWSEAEVYQCKSCGAKEILDNQEMSMSCPFCGTNNIVKLEELPGIKPQGVAPFKITKEQSSAIAIKWAKKKKYAPRVFKKSVKPENINGIYNPVFTFDADTQSSYYGQLGENYKTYTIVNGRRISETKTRYFNISGNHYLKFDDLIVQASDTIPQKDIKKIQPFPTNNAPEYKSEYLRGYSANTYNKDGETCWNECKIEMKNRIEKSILKKYIYDVKVFLNVKTAYLNEKYKFVLVPVWVGHFKYKNKLYNFFVNGDNGNISGKTPISALKVFFTVLGILALIAGIFALLTLT